MVVMVVIMVVVVSMARTEFWQSKEHEREHQRPANVLDAFLGQHGYL